MNFTQKRVDIVIAKSVITDHFSVFYHSKLCCPAFHSLKEWKFNLLYLESRPTHPRDILYYKFI